MVADDHPVFRDGLAMLLGSVDGFAVVGTAANGVAAVPSAVEPRSNSQIAATQYPSPKTVGNNVSHVFAKLQVADRAEAIVRAREAGPRPGRGSSG